MEQSLHLPPLHALQSDESTPPMDGELGVYSFTSGSFGSPSRLDASGNHGHGQGEGMMGASVLSPGRSTPDVLMMESAAGSQLPFVSGSKIAGTAGEAGGGGAPQGPQQPSWTFPDQSAHATMSIGEEFNHLSNAKARGEERVRFVRTILSA